MNLVPSVTTILQVAARPGLDAWKQEQTILACLTLPKIDGESEADYISRIKQDAKAQAEKAAEKGTQIHAWVQMGFEDKGIPPEGLPFYVAAYAELLKECGKQTWIPEHSFATPLYGGKIDLHDDEYLIDVKTTEKDLETIKTWDEHAMQLAAYDYGLNGCLRKCGILYINSIEATARLLFIKREEIERGMKCFDALLQFWYSKTGLHEGRI
jgi:hypothetical protein